MKKVKTFEDYNIDFNFKKYIICASIDIGSPFILEILSNDDKYIYFNHIVINKRNEIIRRPSATNFTTPGVLNNRVLYQTDDINDLINMFEIIKCSDKYNL